MLTAFDGTTRIATGAEADILPLLRAHMPAAALLVFDDATGRVVDLDLRPDGARGPVPPRRGRPRLGVKAREVTLLPCHWDWLSRQPKGASGAIRTLIDAAMAAEETAPSLSLRQDRTYRFLQAIAGDLPGYEDALRALYRGDVAGVRAPMADWPDDVADHAWRLFRP